MVKMGTVWDRTTEFLSDRLSALMPLVLLAIFVPSAVSGSIEGLGAADGGMRIAVAVVGVLLTLVTVWGQLAIMAAALDLGGAGVATRRLVPVILVSIVLLVLFILLVAPIPLLLVATGYDLQAAIDGAMPDVPPAGALSVAIYILAIVPLLFWLFARLVVTTPVVVAEDRVLGAIPRSWQLTKGHALRIVGVLLLYIVVSLVAVGAAQGVFGSIFELVAGGEGAFSPATVLTAVVVAAVTTALSVLQAAFVAKLYQALLPSDPAADFA